MIFMYQYLGGRNIVYRCRIDVIWNCVRVNNKYNILQGVKQTEWNIQSI